ncbi:type VI secretion system Vgr family protein [Rhodovulum euryhalinum]|uniref:Type VI secretion system secreted protein VgrG n=1 Tax=Rhodovulum euryhalinum TaxID=35805 RepID=A0A4R2KDW5_9RHOB|nr:type VI secretion system tip protein TssI/VgrG [Rhodovulum euryhalinum]TCO70522.1 type VI secretion system secreted protein VgrG [Rhodovulum euryhalinum]
MFEDRHFAVRTPLDEDVLRFAYLEGQDEISAPFLYRVGLVSPDLEVDPADLLGQPIGARVGGLGEDPRWFHGLAAEFRMDRLKDGFAFYEVVLRPWLWFLGNRTDNRIFQNMSTIDIVEEVFGAYPSAAYEKRLQGSYAPREYCVQYGESDLDFVQRLLEDEGIFYFFEHDIEGHRLILTDAPARLVAAGDLDEVVFEPDAFVTFRDGDYITRWQPCTTVVTGKYVQTDYDFEKPSADLATRADDPRGHEMDDGERYHYPGGYVQVSAGDARSRIRLEEVQAPARRAEAVTTAPALLSGAKFRLTGFPREAENAEYMILRASYTLREEQYRSGPGADRLPQGYEAKLVLAPTALPFRPERRTRWPVMKGPQTATVVGPAGAEIFTDKYSRVKVQFHWDRLGGRDENSSCFVRVSTAWAGAGWGFIQIPRIGQEVIVDFLEGDPDRPLITGRVYNAGQMPPYGLPGNETQSGWKSMSSPGGGGWNELRFEDKKGSEEVWFQAEKDHNELVKNNETRTIGNDWVEDVGHDATQSVGHDRTESVGNDKSTTVGNNRAVKIGVNDDEIVGSNRSLTVGVDEKIAVGSNSSETIGVNHSQSVGSNQSVSVGASRDDSVGASETRTVGSDQSQTVGASRSVSVGADQSHQVGAADNWAVGAARSTQIAKTDTTRVGTDQSIDVGGARALKVGKSSTTDVAQNMAVKVGKNLVLEAGDSIVLKVGKAAISMKKDGTISIEGKDITTKGSGKITVKATGDVTIKGSKINQN